MKNWQECNTAQSIGQYSLEDVKKAWEFGVLYTKGSAGQAQNYTFDKVIQSLSTQQLPTKSTKDSWTREEVEELIHRAVYELVLVGGEPQYAEGFEINNWIKENL